MANKLTSAEAFELIKAEYIKRCNEQCEEWKDSDPKFAEYCSANIVVVNAIDGEDLVKLFSIIQSGIYDESVDDYYDLVLSALIDTDS